jgi:hypothetical protein
MSNFRRDPNIAFVDMSPRAQQEPKWILPIDHILV